MFKVILKQLMSGLKRKLTQNLFPMAQFKRATIPRDGLLLYVALDRAEFLEPGRHRLNASLTNFVGRFLNFSEF